MQQHVSLWSSEPVSPHSPEVVAGILAKKFFQMLIYNTFLPILTMKRCSTLQFSYSSGNNEGCGKEYKETGFPWTVTVISEIVVGLQRRQGKMASASKKLHGVWRLEVLCVHNSLYKLNVFKRLLAAINMAYVH